MIGIHEYARQMRLKGYSEKTVTLYKTCVRALAKMCEAPALSLGPEQIRSFLAKLADQKRSTKTIRLYYEALKHYYRAHGQEHRLPRIVFRADKKTLPEILSPRQALDLIQGCQSLRLKTILAIAYSSGLRIAEILSLREEDINEERMLIHVRNGKGGRDRYAILAHACLPMLRHYKALYRPSSFIFYSSKDESSPISTSSIQRAFREHARKNGLPSSVRIHTLRHCFATHLLENGTNLFHIMKLLGHSRIETTMRYLHVQPVDTLAVTSPLDKFAGETIAINRQQSGELPFCAQSDI